MENFIFCAVIVKNIYNEEHEKVKATASLKVTGSLSFFCIFGSNHCGQNLRKLPAQEYNLVKLQVE